MLEKDSVPYKKMIRAFFHMRSNPQTNQRCTSRMFEVLRPDFSKIMSESQKGKNNSQHGTTWIANFKTKEYKKEELQEWLGLGWLNKKTHKFHLYDENGKRKVAYVCPSVLKAREEKRLKSKKLKKTKLSKTKIISKKPKQKRKLNPLQTYRRENGKDIYIPEPIKNIQSFYKMTKCPTNMGFNFLADDLIVEFERFRDSLQRIP